jgi:murein peptide amidase A
VKRLGINKGRYHGEGINIAEYLREFHAAAQTRGWSAEKFATIDKYDLHGYQRGPENPRRTVYISTGIHGDEPAGTIALRRCVEEDRWPADTHFILCPCINPTGLVAVTRENKNGVDLNRDYRHAHTEEVRAHTAWLRSLPQIDLALLLHEDWEAEGYYVYEVNPHRLPPLGPRVIEAVREMCPIQGSAKIDGMWDCVDGIIIPHLKPDDRPLWAEAIYLIVHKSRQNLTLEAPSDFPLLFRSEAHMRAIRAALAQK